MDNNRWWIANLKSKKMEGLILRNVELTLGELLVQKEVILRLYNGITDFNKMLEVEEKVIEPLDKIFKLYDKKVKQLKEKKKESSEASMNKEYQNLLSEKINITLACVKKQDILGAGYNVYEYRMIKEFVLD